MPATKARTSAPDNYQCSRLLAPIKALPLERARCTYSFSVASQSYLKDHRVAGKVIYPAAAFSMTGLSVYQMMQEPAYRQSPVALKEIKFRHALTLPHQGSTLLQLGYNSSQGAFTIHSKHISGCGSPTLHASGKLALTSIVSSSCGSRFNEQLTRCDKTLDVAGFYQRLRRTGLEYGAYFQRIDYLAASRCGGEAVSRLVPHPDLATSRDSWAQSTTLLDAAFQTLAAALEDESPALYVPMRIAALQVFGDFDSNLWCYARQVKSNNRIVSGDISLFGSSGRLLVEIRGLQCLKKGNAHATEFNKANPNHCIQDFRLCAGRD